MTLGVLASALKAEPTAPEGGFTWHRGAGAEACLSEPDLRAKIAGMLGRDPFSGGGAPSVHGTVDRLGEELVASVQMRESAGAVETARVFEVPSGDCGPLTDAVALALTLALSPDGSVENTSALPTVSAPPSAAAGPPANAAAGPPLALSPTTNPDPGVLVAPNRAEGVRPWTGLVEGSWSLGALPRPVVGIGFELRHGLGSHFAVALGGAWLPPASEGGQFSVSLVRTRLSACALPYHRESFAILVCGGGEGGALRVGKELASPPSAGYHAWFGAGANARASVQLGAGWVLEGGAGATIPAIRPIYRTFSCPLLGFQEPIALLTIFISTGVRF